MHNLVYLNGDYLPLEEAKISVLDRGFLFADGVYEVIPVYNGRFFRSHEHLRRLDNSLKAIKLPIDITPEKWHTIFETLIEKNGLQNQTKAKAIYLQVTRGADKTRAHPFPNPPISPTVFAMVYDLKQPSFETLEKGATVVTLPDIRWEHCFIKSISLLPNILARESATQQGADEAIFIRDGYLLEGSSSNVFIVKDGVVKTPPESKHMLGGITRELVIELMKKHAIPFEETAVSLDELHCADEIWITSATRDVMPVTQIDGKKVGQGIAGPIWHKVIRYFDAYKASL